MAFPFIPLLVVAAGGLALAGSGGGSAAEIGTATIKIPPVPDPGPGGEPPTLTTPAPGAYVQPTPENTRPVHVFASRAGAKFVDLDWGGDAAMVWRAYFGTAKDKKNWSTSRWAELDPVIGRNKIWRNAKKKLGTIFQAAGNLLAFRFGKMGNNVADLLTANELLAFDGGQQVTARLMVRATAQALINAALEHPRNANLPTVPERGGELGPERTFPTTAANFAIYLPTSEEITEIFA